MIGLTSDELMEMGITKIGHRKKIVTALGNLPSEDVQPKFKPSDVSEWLACVGLQQYEGIMEDAGYDDIDYVKDITEEELKEIGVKKPGHLKKFQKSIAKLCNLPKAPAGQSNVTSKSKSPAEITLPQSKVLLQEPHHLNQDYVKQAFEPPVVSQASSSNSLDKDEAYSSQGSLARRSMEDRHTQRSNDDDEFTMSDITGVLDNALGGFEEDSKKTRQDPGADALLVELDDMLADLSTQIDVILPRK